MNQWGDSKVSRKGHKQTSSEMGGGGGAGTLGGWVVRFEGLSGLEIVVFWCCSGFFIVNF